MRYRELCTSCFIATTNVNFAVRQTDAFEFWSTPCQRQRQPFLHPSIVNLQLYLYSSDDKSENNGSPFRAVPPSDNLRKKEELRLAYAFLESIQQQPECIKDSNGMYVFNEMVFLEGEETLPLIIRKNTEQFWNTVIEKVSETKPNGRNMNRICVVGTPGIGKTRATCYLIRMLLERGKTVVYFIRRMKQNGVYYEFIPGRNNVTDVLVSVYKELERDEIPSLLSTQTYFIVDPGVTKDNCNEDTNFKPKVIIVSSPDEHHWGGSDFEKEREGIEGFFMYMPVWELDELLFATPFLCHIDPQLEELLKDPLALNQEILDRYRIFGGVPRHIFGRQDSRNRIMVSQDRAIKALPTEQVNLLFEKDSTWVDTFQKDQPKSIVMHYTSSVDNAFELPRTCVASYFVYEKIVAKFMMGLWSNMLDDKSGKMLEAYLRYLLCQPDNAIRFENRPCVGKSDPDYNKYHHELLLGGCIKIQGVLDPIVSALANPMVLFYSNSDSYPLFDFCYKDNGKYSGETRLVLVQATTSTTHDAKENSLKDLAKKLEKENVDLEDVLLCYAVPSNRYKEFTTNPVNPNRKENLLCEIRHINVVKPIKEFSTEGRKWIPNIFLRFGQSLLARKTRRKK
jgi:hypothetical protein